MSLENLEKIVDKSEALLYYDVTKKENAALKEQVRDLQQQLEDSRDEAAKFKSYKTNFAGREVSLDEFEVEQQNFTRKFYGEEIERKATEKFETEKSSLTANEVNRLLKLPKHERPLRLNNLLDEEKNREVNNILNTESSWPPWSARARVLSGKWG